MKREYGCLLSGVKSYLVLVGAPYSANPQNLAEMGREARAEYEANYTAERNYEMLMKIYRLAIERARARA
jgi:hypothetical protein